MRRGMIVDLYTHLYYVYLPYLSTSGRLFSLMLCPASRILSRVISFFLYLTSFETRLLKDYTLYATSFPGLQLLLFLASGLLYSLRFRYRV